MPYISLFYFTACRRPGIMSGALLQHINDTIELRDDTRQEYPVGTVITSRCNDPGKQLLTPSNSVYRYCTPNGWTGQAPSCGMYRFPKP